MSGKTKIWIKNYGGWAWKVVLGITVACTWWMKLNFATKEEVREMQNLVTKTEFKDSRMKQWESISKMREELSGLRERVGRLEERTEKRNER